MALVWSQVGEIPEYISGCEGCLWLTGDAKQGGASHIQSVQGRGRAVGRGAVGAGLVLELRLSHLGASY